MADRSLIPLSPLLEFWTRYTDQTPRCFALRFRFNFSSKRIYLHTMTSWLEDFLPFQITFRHFFFLNKKSRKLFAMADRSRILFQLFGNSRQKIPTKLHDSFKFSSIIIAILHECGLERLLLLLLGILEKK